MMFRSVTYCRLYMGRFDGRGDEGSGKWRRKSKGGGGGRGGGNSGNMKMKVREGLLDSKTYGF